VYYVISYRSAPNVVMCYLSLENKKKLNRCIRQKKEPISHYYFHQELCRIKFFGALGWIELWGHPRSLSSHRTLPTPGKVEIAYAGRGGILQYFG